VVVVVVVVVVMLMIMMMMMMNSVKYGIVLKLNEHEILIPV
jgi:hypothetical protein